VFRFRVLETPICHTIEDVLLTKRPKAVLHHQLLILDRFTYHRVIWILLGISFAFNVVRLCLSEQPSNVWFSVLFHLTFYTMVPLLPWSLITMGLMARTFGNAKILALFESLQQSHTPFDDDADVDEFDEEAPPPTKNITVTKGNIVWFNSTQLSASYIILTNDNIV
jgi:hypothetical protein